jgi:SAM-dependent methyltransferase/MFS family permease
MPLYAATTFFSAFLLFLVQPITAKQILPWFGGSAAVWTTCLVFFQTTLLLGYAYSDAVARRLSPRRQVGLHVTLLILSCALLPIVPGMQWKPLGNENPSLLILGLLAATIGLPYFLLSTTSPLVQAWFARTYPGRSPYRLFALSNLASMLALLGYPFALEPWIPTRLQSYGWSAAYVAFALLAAASAWFAVRRPREAPAAVPEPVPDGDGRESAPTVGRQILWTALAATGSFLLLAVSNHITQNIASIPLLWIAPLSIYLLTFILCFDSTRWYRRATFRAMLAAAVGAMGWTLADSDLTHQLALQIGVFCAGLFLACMFCHGELSRLKPAPRYLTRFYLMVSLGGAIGSVLVGIVAPLILPAYFELAFGLIACAALLAWQVRRAHPVFIVLSVAALLFSVGAAGWSIHGFYENTVLATRNFYGVLRVQEWNVGTANYHRSLIHGTILHGTQYPSPELERQPTTYYTATSGIGRAIDSRHPSLEPLRIGIIGLGTGTIAAWGSKGDIYRFYDINPAVIGIAKRDFTFLGKSDATIEIALGDARLSLEREKPENFDVLAIDAFSSDAIPVHLITSEALAVYRRHMKPGGIIAFHVTNRYLDLAPVVQQLADAQGLSAVLVADDGEEPIGSRSDWVLLSDSDEPLETKEIDEVAETIDARPGWRLWTDDFNNIVQVLKRE